jgi:hypothetical protein
MDLFTSSSDLDLSLELADGRLDRSRNDKVHYLRKVAKALYGLQNGEHCVFCYYLEVKVNMLGYVEFLPTKARFVS